MFTPTQYGDINGYCRNTLKLSAACQNFDLLPLQTVPNMTILAFMDVENIAAATSIIFSQSASYQIKTHRLTRGLNALTMPTFSLLVNGRRTGGLLMYGNAYTHDVQGDVRIRIVGAKRAMVFTEGDDQDEFLTALEAEYNFMMSETDFSKHTTADVAGLICESVSVVSTLTGAHHAYIKSNFKPADFCTFNNYYMRDLLFPFYGVTPE
ncbi:MAG: hypothetical protein ACRC5V_05145 [Aeromonas sp.]